LNVQASGICQMKRERRTREELSSEQIFALLNSLLLNAHEVRGAWEKGWTPPPFRTKRGITIYHRWPVDPASFLFHEIFLLNCYTSNNFYSPKKGDTIVDCGANIGVFALYLTTLERKLHIHCFEPSESTCAQLRLNVEANKLHDVISVHQQAIWRDNKQQVLLSGKSSGRHSFFRQPDEQIPHCQETVSCITLAEALDFCDGRDIELLKIDAEGAELEIVENADSKTLSTIQRLALEYHEKLRPRSRERLISHLELNGFNEICVTAQRDLGEAIGIIQATRFRE
jgi:FkbM family methyltransferase